MPTELITITKDQNGQSAGEGFGKSASKTDHALSLDMAKEIAMIQRTEKGKQARQYFIECEKQLREQVLIPDQNFKNILHVNGNAIEIPEDRPFSFSISKGGTVTVRVKEGKSKPEPTAIPDKQTCVEKCPHYIDQSEVTRSRIMNLLIDSPDWLTSDSIARHLCMTKSQTEYYLYELWTKGVVTKQFSSSKGWVFSLAKRIPPK